MSPETQKWLPAEFQYTREFEEETESTDRPMAEEAIVAQLCSHFAEQPPSVHSENILALVVEHFPVANWSLIPSDLASLLDEILTRWAQALADPQQPSEEEATEIAQALLLFTLSELHPLWVAEIEEEEPFFEVVYTIHMVGSTQITATTPQLLDGRIETTYEALDIVNCDIESHEEVISPLNDAARHLLRQWGRLKEEHEVLPAPLPETERTEPAVSSELEELVQELDGLAHDILSQPGLFPAEYGWNTTRQAALCLKAMCLLAQQREEQEEEKIQFVQLQISRLPKREKELILAVAGMFSWNLEHLTPPQKHLTPPQTGMRVQTIVPIDRAPLFQLTGTGLTGIVTLVEKNLILIKMDEHIPGCEAWENEIQLSSDELGNYGQGFEITSMAELFYSYFAPLPGGTEH